MDQEMTSEEILRLANENGTVKNGKWCFTNGQLLNFVDDILNYYSTIETKVLKDMFDERDKELLRLQRKLEDLLGK